MNKFTWIAVVVVAFCAPLHGEWTDSSGNRHLGTDPRIAQEAAEKAERQKKEEERAQERERRERQKVVGQKTDPLALEPTSRLKQKAESGDQDARCALAKRLLDEKEPGRDPAEGAKWYRMAAAQGHARGQSGLGWCYLNGFGVNKDETEAVKWYRKAVDQGDAKGQNNLGYCYESGKGVTKDESEAVKWYRKAADQGDATAQGNLGVCYANGKGVTKDETEAVKWYRMAADQGNAKAQNNLGYCYKEGKGVAKDEMEAVKWYRKAADQGDARGQVNLGYCYERGDGVYHDSSEAVRWYRKAAEQGYAPAQNNLGYCYKQGKGVAKDEMAAVKWYRKAAEQGQATAQYNLGACYALGQGVPKDEAEAVKWFTEFVSGPSTMAERERVLSRLEALGPTMRARCEELFKRIPVRVAQGAAENTLDSTDTDDISRPTTEHDGVRLNQCVEQLTSQGQHRFRRFDNKLSFDKAWATVVGFDSTNKTVLLPHQSAMVVTQATDGIIVQVLGNAKLARIVVDPLLTGQLTKESNHLVLTARDSSLWACGSDGVPVYALQTSSSSTNIAALLNRPVSDLHFIGCYQSVLKTPVSHTVLFSKVTAIGVGCGNVWYIAATGDEDVLLPLCLKEAAATVAKERAEKRREAKLQDQENGRKEVAKKLTQLLNDAKTEKEEARAQALGPAPTSSSWSGKVYEVDAYLHRVLKDPDSLQYIDWYKPAVITYQGEQYWAVRVTYRAKNSFGGYVIGDGVALMQSGMVVNFIKTNDDD